MGGLLFRRFQRFKNIRDAIEKAYEVNEAVKYKILAVNASVATTYLAGISYFMSGSIYASFGLIKKALFFSTVGATYFPVALGLSYWSVSRYLKSEEFLKTLTEVQDSARKGIKDMEEIMSKMKKPKE